MSPVYRIGTRKSALARTQSNYILGLLKARGIRCELVELDSLGDSDKSTPLYEIDPESPGVFTKQLEVALLANQVDIAVHSFKDLPTRQPEGLRVACRDCA